MNARPQPSLAAVQAALHRRYIAAEGAGLREEDLRKAIEVQALLGELGRLGRDPLLVDAAAGKAYVGALAAELLGFARVVVIEREARLLAGLEGVERRCGDLSDPALWPERADAVVALHACGAASDAVIGRALAIRARRLFLVPCCYGAAVPFWAPARALAERLGLPGQAAPLARVLTGLVDAERTLRLEAGGYEVTVAPLVPPTVTPHNLLWRARWSGEPRRMAAAAERLARLRALATEA